ncbi:MAG: PadR family transcriptional regulator [Erysipelotrichaceae bacterium]|nr:PadR family transcriptional regulator [Erysipelotrichaceae bacterium]
MRTLKYAILGLLTEDDMTYADIKEEINGLIGQFWSAKNSQIAPELRKLSQEGAIIYTQESTLYHVTEYGREEFLRWAIRDEACDTIEKDAFCMRLLFSDNIERSQTVQLLKSQIGQHKAKLKYLELSLPLLLKDPSNIGEQLVQKRIISKEQAYIDWLEECLSYFND